MHHHAFHRLEAGRDMMRIGVGLEDVLALNEDALERAVGGSIQHIGDAQARLAVQLHAPGMLEYLPRRPVRNMAVA